MPIARALLIAALFLVRTSLQAQTGSIMGRVMDDEGAPLSGATVIVEGTDRGAIARTDGTFTIDQLMPGQYTIAGRYVGFDTVRSAVAVSAGIVATVDLRLAPRAQRKTIEVTASRRQAQSDTRPSVTKIEPREAKYLPGAAEDVLRSLRSLPGVVAPNDFSSQLVVRGSGPDQNLIVIDGMEIFNPYRLYGFVSMFNPETVSDITLMSGGFPARYGDRLSAVLDVTNRRGSAQSGWIDGKMNVSATNANVILEGNLPSPLNGGWLISGRRTYYDLILGPIARSAKLVDGDVAFPNFRDLQIKSAFNPWRTHSFSLIGITSRDGTEIASSSQRDQLDSVSINDRSYNSLIGGSWFFTPSTDFITRTTASWYQNSGETVFGGEGGSRFLYGDVSRDSLATLIRALPAEIQDSLRARGITPENPPAFGISDGNAGFTFSKYSLENETTLSLPAQRITLGAGLDYIRTDIAFSVDRDSLLEALRAAQGRSEALDSVQADVRYTRAHAFLEDRIAIGDNLWLQPGLRFDYYQLLEKSYLAPRLNASYAIDPLTTIRAAYGLYYQSPGYEKLVDRRRYFDFASSAVKNLRAEQSTHYVFGIERMVTDEWQLRLEGYYKSFEDLIVSQRLQGTRWISNPIAGEDPRLASGWTAPVPIIGDSTTAVPVNEGTGDAYGVEILLQKIGSSGTSRLNGWIGYTLAWANRHRGGVTYPFSFDQRHTVNIVMNYKVNDWLEVGGNFQYGSGFPYTPPVEIRPLVVFNTDSIGERNPAIATNIFGELLFTIDRGDDANENSARLPAYHRLDLRATISADWWDLDWSIYLDVINVYNHKNILSRSYSVDKQTVSLTEREVSMLPILPTIGVSVVF